jgi:hypothetical protein
MLCFADDAFLDRIQAAIRVLCTAGTAPVITFFVTGHTPKCGANPLAKYFNYRLGDTVPVMTVHALK